MHCSSCIFNCIPFCTHFPLIYSTSMITYLNPSADLSPRNEQIWSVKEEEALRETPPDATFPNDCHSGSPWVTKICSTTVQSYNGTERRDVWLVFGLLAIALPLQLCGQHLGTWQPKLLPSYQWSCDHHLRLFLPSSHNQCQWGSWQEKLQVDLSLPHQPFFTDTHPLPSFVGLSGHTH